MSWRRPTVREVVGAVGVVALAGALATTFAPGLLPASVVDGAAAVESQVEPWVVVLVLSLVVFAYAVYRFWRADDGTVERLVRDDDDSAPEFDDVRIDFDPDRPGRAFDWAMARTVAQLEADPNADAWEADRIREDLTTAVLAVRTGRGEDPSAVRAAVESGTWTEDRVAASFLGGPDAPSVSLWRRVYAWLYPARAFQRRVERVVSVVERQAGVSELESTGDDQTDGGDESASAAQSASKDEGDGSGAGSGTDGSGGGTDGTGGETDAAGVAS